MEEQVNSLLDLQEVDIFTKQILGKKVLPCVETLWQEAYDDGIALGEKEAFRLYILNDGTINAPVPPVGSPVVCVKLCKRIIEPDFPRNTLICTHKSRVTHRYELILLVEFENGNFTVINLPRNLSNPAQYDPLITRAFVDNTVINALGVPVVQHQNEKIPNETLVIVSLGVNDYPSFEYTVTIPFTEFCPRLKPCELEDPSLQSFILLKNLKYDVDVLDTLQVPTFLGNSVWTTVVDITITEDIIDKLGIDQDVIVRGVPEFTCR